MSGSSGGGRADRAIRVLIADDHSLLRTGLRMILEDEPDMEVVGEAANGAQALNLASALRPAVVLADISMPPPDGIELARLLRREAPSVRTIIVSMHEDEAMLRDALAAGAAGYVVKRSGPTELLRAIRRAVVGEVYIDQLLRPHDNAAGAM